MNLWIQHLNINLHILTKSIHSISKSIKYLFIYKNISES